jgi:hypothetical protein
MKIKAKIIIACIALVALAATTFLATILVQRGRVHARMAVLIEATGVERSQQDHRDALS